MDSIPNQLATLIGVVASFSVDPIVMLGAVVSSQMKRYPVFLPLLVGSAIGGANGWLSEYAGKSPVNLPLEVLGAIFATYLWVLIVRGMTGIRRMLRPQKPM